MNVSAIWLAPLALACLAPAALAQHSDIEFSYEGGKIAIEFGPGGRVVKGAFPLSGISEQFTTNPGFASETDEGLGITPRDWIDYSVLGPLVYHDGTSFAPAPAGAQIRISDNPSGSLVVSGATTGPVSGPGVIGQASDGVAPSGLGDFHAHVDFALEPLALGAPQFGAYGILLRLSSFSDDGGSPGAASGIADSDPFYLVFNFGLDDATFAMAANDFAAAVPEPATWSLMALALVGWCAAAYRRRRR